MGNGAWSDRATQYYAKLKILKLEDLIKLETSAFVYKFKSQKLPITFDDYFATLNSIHDKPTRATSSHNNFVIPYYKTQKLRRSIKYQGPKIWNSQELDIKQSKSMKLFKTRMKHLLIKNYDD